MKKMELALVGYQLAGFQTNVSFLKELITVPDFTEAEEHPDKLNTGLIGRHIDRKVKNNSPSMQTIALFLAHELREHEKLLVVFANYFDNALTTLTGRH